MKVRFALQWMTDGPDRSSSSEQLSVGAWIGIAAGVLVVVAASVFAVRKIKRRKNNASNSSRASSTISQLDEDLSKMEHEEDLAAIELESATVPSNIKQTIPFRSSGDRDTSPSYTELTIHPRPAVTTTLGSN